jgi:hypothetical protein
MTNDELITDTSMTGNIAEDTQQDLSGAPNDADTQQPIYNKRQVSDIIKREQQKAFEKGKRETMMELQQAQEAQQQAQQVPAQQQSQQSLGGMPQMSEDDIRRMISEQAPQVLQNQFHEYQTKQTVDSFVNKMKAAEERYPGLEAQLNELNYDSPSTIGLVKMANELENTGDIMNELVTNPMKMANLSYLMHEQPHLAKKAMRDLSNSIKVNQEAMQDAGQYSVKEPHSQLKPSSSAGIDNSKMTVSDYRKMFKN